MSPAAAAAATATAGVEEGQFFFRFIVFLFTCISFSLPATGFDKFELS